jgi:hypothetical protein
MGISFSLALIYTQYPLIIKIKEFLDKYKINDEVNLKNSPNYLNIISKRSYLTVKEKNRFKESCS